MTYSDNRRDAREKDFLAIITDRAKELGCLTEWFPNSRLAGYDGVLCINGKTAMVEIKSNTHADLTPAEFAAWERARKAGVIIRRVDCDLAARALADEMCGNVEYEFPPHIAKAVRMARSVRKQPTTRKRARMARQLEQIADIVTTEDTGTRQNTLTSITRLR